MVGVLIAQQAYNANHQDGVAANVGQTLAASAALHLIMVVVFLTLLIIYKAADLQDVNFLIGGCIVCIMHTIFGGVEVHAAMIYPDAIFMYGFSIIEFSLAVISAINLIYAGIEAYDE